MLIALIIKKEAFNYWCIFENKFLVTDWKKNMVTKNTKNKEQKRKPSKLMQFHK